MNGLLANHLQWIYEPASLLMMVLSFYSYKYFFDHREKWGLDERWAFSLACWIPGMIGYWIAGLGFLALDTITGENGKVYKVNTDDMRLNVDFIEQMYNQYDISKLDGRFCTLKLPLAQDDDFDSKNDSNYFTKSAGSFGGVSDFDGQSLRIFRCYTKSSFRRDHFQYIDFLLFMRVSDHHANHTIFVRR